MGVTFEAVKEVASPAIFGVGIIILVFLPLMTLQGMEGKMSRHSHHHRHRPGDIAGALPHPDAGARLRFPAGRGMTPG